MLLFVDRLGSSVSAKESDCPFLRLQMEFVLFLRRFIHENRNILDKKIAVFICFSGGGADKAIEKMKKYIGIEEFEAELILIDPKEHVKAEDETAIENFCINLEDD